MKYVIIIALVLCFGYGFYATRTVPVQFPHKEIFLVDENESLKNVSLRLEDEHIIHSALLFRTWASFLGKDRNLQLGYYTFDKPLVLGAVLKRMFATGPDQPLVRITIPEGSTDKEIADIVHRALPEVNIDRFGEIIFSRKATGKLFPETYFLLPSANEEKIINKMVATCNKNMLQFDGTPFPQEIHSRDEIIVLASILEGEAKSKEDMILVSGILQNRLAKNMPLQVDAEKSTYKVRGLPSMPINNPGINALYAAYHPAHTDYLYYITGTNGSMYYAKTFTEHKANIKKYLQ